MIYTIRVVDRNNIIKFESEFDRKHQVDIEKLKKEYQERYKDCVVEVT